MSGATTLFEGLGERMWTELKQLTPSSNKIQMIAPPERDHSVWLGGSILASLPTF